MQCKCGKICYSEEDFEDHLWPDSQCPFYFEELNKLETLKRIKYLYIDCDFKDLLEKEKYTFFTLVDKPHIGYKYYYAFLLTDPPLAYSCGLCKN